MTNLHSERMGGGLIYSPAMMKFDGSTGYYSKAHTSAGNKHTTIVRFKINAFTGGTMRRTVWVQGSAQTRLHFSISSSDHATAGRRSKCVFSVTNSVGTPICFLVSSIVVADGLLHTAFISFDGDAGTATFIIDGINVDDVANGERVTPAIGTLSTGVGTINVGSNNSGTEFFLGDIGFVGHREAYLTNWSDFMYPDGTPKAINESSWTEWGAQPLFWNKHGDMVNNLGSAGAMTKNGTINVGDGGAGPFPMIGLPTVGTAIAENIQEGKTAWVNGLSLTGTKAANSGILLLCVNPTISDSSYNPATENGAVIILKPPIVLDSSGGGGWVLGTNGFCTNLISYANYIVAVGASHGVPAYTTKRKYEMWGRVADVALTDTEGVRILFNISSNLYTDYWLVSLTWNNASGYFVLYIIEVAASSGFVRTSVPFTTALDLPAEFHLIVYEQGDAVIAQCSMYETDSITDDETVSCAYTVGSRAQKTQTRFAFGLDVDPETDWLIRGCKISDLL